MSKTTMEDVNQIISKLDAKLETILKASKHPDYFSIEDIKDILSTPECVGSLASKAYPIMDEFIKTCNADNCEQEVLDEVEMYAWYKIYNDWDLTELEAAILKEINY